MPTGRILVAGALLIAALAVQVALLTRLPLPGATPDLTLLCVVGLALAHGPGFGVVAGFCTGLGSDLVPPADHAVGRWALVLALVGYLAGLARPEAHRSALLPLVVVATASAGSLLLFAGQGFFLQDAHVTWSAVVAMLPTAVGYDVVLSAFVVPGVLTLVDRFEPDPAVRR